MNPIICIDCSRVKPSIFKTGSFQCGWCRTRLIKKLNENARDLDRIEPRLTFLKRVAKNLDLRLTDNQIHNMANNGFSDIDILDKERFGKGLEE